MNEPLQWQAPNPAVAEPLLAQLLPNSVVVAAYHQQTNPQWLYPEEAQCLPATASSKRWDEFTAGRLCGRRVLSQLGIHQFPLLRNNHQAPQWPSGIVGSITHTKAYRAAVAANTSAIKAVGIDAEEVAGVGEKLWPKIATDKERQWLAAIPAYERQQLAALIFSGKEAFYKCQHTLSEAWLGFQDVELVPEEWDMAAGIFALKVLKAVPNIDNNDLFWGRFYINKGLVVSAICMV